MLKKILISPWTALLTLSLVIGLRVADPSFVESVRLRYFDTLITSQPATPLNIYAANIDEATLDKYGQWPLDRSVYAILIKDLYARGAGLVVLNVMMSETDRQGGDAKLAKTMAEAPVILVNVPSQKTKNTPRNPGSAVINSEYVDRIITYHGIIANVPKLEEAAAGIGTINTLPEIDGVNRRLPLVVSVDGKLYPSLAMEVLRVAADDTTFQVKLSELGIDKMRIKKFGSIATDNLGRIWIDWSQQPQNISIMDLPKDLAGAIVIVGPTAAGISNPVPTAIGAQFPHYVQAVVAGTLLNRVNIERPDYADGAEIIALLVAGLLLLFLTRWTYVGIIASVVFIGGCVYGSSYLYDNYRWLLDITIIVAGLVVVLFHAYIVRFVSEFLQKLQIKKQFGGYVSPVIVERLQKNPSLIKLGGDSKELTVIMTDMRNFTALGESYGDRVEEFTNTMNRYMTAIAEPILDNEGCLIKFIGDASLHVHGAPLDDPRHAARAVATGLAMLRAVENFNQELALENRPPVGMGVGINTGPTLIGNIGSKTRFGYDVLGDTVSLAARLEGQTKPYGVKIILGPLTAEQVKHEYFVLELDKIAVKGKKVGVNIFTVLDGSYKEYEIGRKDHEEMLAAYRNREFENAIFLCDTLMGEFDGQMNAYYEMWKDRCREMKMSKLPQDWDGTYVSTSK